MALHTFINPQLLHYDIKSENLLLDCKGNARICDAGFCMPMQADSSVAMAHSTRMGHVGTQGYIDPWYVENNMYQPWCDVYSAGIVVLEAVTGQPAMVPKGALRTKCRGKKAELIRCQSVKWPGSSDQVLLGIAWSCCTDAGEVESRPEASRAAAMVEELLSDQTIVVAQDERECLICMANQRGFHRTTPCLHAVACGDCYAMLQARGDGCPLCVENIVAVEEGYFPHTFMHGSQAEAN